MTDSRPTRKQRRAALYAAIARRDPWVHLADMIDAGRSAVEQGRTRPDRAEAIMDRWAEFWLGERLVVWRTTLAGRRVRVESAGLLEALWLVLDDLEPPTARKLDDPRPWRRSRGMWLELPDAPRPYVSKAIEKKARVLAADREAREDFDGFELDRRAAARLAKDSLELWRARRADSDELDELGAEPGPADPSGESLELAVLSAYIDNEATESDIALIEALGQLPPAEALDAVGRKDDWAGLQSLQRKLRRRVRAAS